MLARLLQHLEEAKQRELLIACTEPNQVHTSIDSSCCILEHPTRRSHRGMSVSQGRGTLKSESTTQQTMPGRNGRHSLGPPGGHLLGLLFCSPRVPKTPGLKSQDNHSTIQLAEDTRSNSIRTRNIQTDKAVFSFSYNYYSTFTLSSICYSVFIFQLMDYLQGNGDQRPGCGGFEKVNLRTERSA